MRVPWLLTWTDKPELEAWFILLGLSLSGHAGALAGGPRQLCHLGAMAASGFQRPHVQKRMLDSCQRDAQGVPSQLSILRTFLSLGHWISC